MTTERGAESLARVARSLLAYTLWGDRAQLAALALLPTADLTRDTGSSFPSLLATMAHVLGAERAWLSRFLGRPLSRLPGIEDYSGLAALASGFEEHWPRVEAFMASLDDEQLAADLTWSNFRGEVFTRPLWNPLFHMVNHASYHRGQVTTMLRQLGHPAPSTDLVDYLAQHA